MKGLFEAGAIIAWYSDTTNPLFTEPVKPGQYRNTLLSNCDWIVSITDYNMANKNDWVAYRQALRDITKQENPFRVMWPVVPV